jgi:hypothetical protein
MSEKTKRRKRYCRSVSTLSAVVLSAAALAGCSTRSTSSARSPAAPSVPTPLATSVWTSAGTWATIPMGRLDEPLNTFWQLMFEPATGAPWSNQVKATATATNGGLVLASARGRSLIVGVRPSVDLTFTPLISTSDAARSWSDGLVNQALAARPDALATDGGGQALALVDERGVARVLASTGDLSAWRTLTTAHALAAGGPGRSCGLGSLTAVSYLAAQALVGGSCAKPGVVGIFAQRDGAWRLSGPDLPPPLSRGRVEVLSLGGLKAGAYGLLAVVRGDKTDLVAAWSGPGGRWATSLALPFAADEHVASFGPAEGRGLFVLLQRSPGGDELFVAGGRGTGWRQLASPPSRTATVAFGTAAPADALVASGTKLTIWSLGAGARSWAPAQVIRVPIEYGSSS